MGLGFDKELGENDDYTYSFLGDNNDYSVELTLKRKTSDFYGIKSIRYSEEIRLRENGQVYMYYYKDSMEDETCSDYRVFVEDSTPINCGQTYETITGSVKSLGFEKQLRKVEKAMLRVYKNHS